ncbi:MAG: HPP family protein [Thermomicrobiales bacterium]
MNQSDSEGHTKSVAKHQRRLSTGDELMLALLPTLTILVVLIFIEALSSQRILFTSLASSAFLIYLDPNHPMNKIRTLITSHLIGLTAGILTFWVFGASYLAAGIAMVVTIFIMVIGDFVYPPAVSTSLIFGLRSGAGSQPALFVVALGMIVILVILERAAVWLLRHLTARDQPG